MMESRKDNEKTEKKLEETRENDQMRKRLTE